ncbi:MAG: ATP-binding protein [Desulfovibrio sp.]|nr:MAG: ATP-binding protein [Desulfovibrio sp.]
MHDGVPLCLDVTLSNDFEDMARCVAQADSFLAKHDLAPRPLYAVRLTLDEILSNIILYAYLDKEPHEIKLRITLSDRDVRLTFEDDGKPFDPVAAPAPDLSVPMEDRPVGGLGIHMVRDMTKTMRYRRDNHCNVLDVWVERGATEKE